MATVCKPSTKPTIRSLNLRRACSASVIPRSPVLASPAPINTPAMRDSDDGKLGFWSVVAIGIGIGGMVGGTSTNARCGTSTWRLMRLA